LFDAYAAVLQDLGRSTEAELWFSRSDRAAAALSSGDESDDLEVEVFEEIGDGPADADDDRDGSGDDPESVGDDPTESDGGVPNA
jgi:hypothetical protein